MAEPADSGATGGSGSPGAAAGPGGSPRATGTGAGRVLVGVYAFFAIAAGARAGWQLATRFDEAPVAYLLSALAAAIYLVAAVALASHGPNARRLATVCPSVEVVSVQEMCGLSQVLFETFPRVTVRYG